MFFAFPILALLQLGSEESQPSNQFLSFPNFPPHSYRLSIGSGCSSLVF